MPHALKMCMDSMRRLNPDWEHRFSTDADWPSALTGHEIFDWESLQRFPTGIQKADVFRCISLYEEGGIYSDIDMLALRPLDSLLSAAIESGLVSEDTELILTTDHPVHCHAIYGDTEILMNHFMVARPKARFLRFFLEHLHSLVKDGYQGSNEPVSTTGPVALTRIVEEQGGTEELKIAIVPYFWIHPLPDMNRSFHGREGYEEILMDGSWRARFCPYLLHCWWHSYWEQPSEIDSLIIGTILDSDRT